MLSKIKKFFEESASEVQSELDEEDYLSAYDTTAGRILRGEEVTRPEESGLDQCACSDPLQKGVLDAITDYEKAIKQAKHTAELNIAQDIVNRVKSHV